MGEWLWLEGEFVDVHVDLSFVFSIDQPSVGIIVFIDFVR